MLLKEITDFLEDIAPLSLQESYDNSGLIIGSLDQKINKTLITLDITEEVIDEAIQENCELIIAHHPVIFKGLKRLNGTDLTQKLVIKSIKSNIAIYAIHTNLDNVTGGVNSILANKLGIKNTRILLPKTDGLLKVICFCPTGHRQKVQEAMFKAGAGQIGDYDNCSYFSSGKGTFKALEGSNPYVGEQNKIHHEDEFRVETIVPDYCLSAVIRSMIRAHPYEEPAYDIVKLYNINTNIGSGMIGELDENIDITEYLKSVKKSLGIQYIKHNQLVNRPIKKIAICGGSGSFLIHAAAKQKADLFITGDIKYHDYFEHTGNMTIVDAGHYETEHPVKELIYSLLNKKFPNFALRISKMSGNPISFL